MIDRTRCPVCGIGGDEHRPQGPEIRDLANDVYEVRCLRCGPFRMTLEDWTEVRTHEQRLHTSSFVRHRHERGLPVPTLCLEPATGRIRDSYTYDDIRAAFPSGIQQIQDEMLRTIAAISKRIRAYGGHAGLGPRDTPIAFTFDQPEMNFHIGWLHREGLADLGNSSEGTTITLTKKGWERVEDLERGTAALPLQAFVAMWFADRQKDPKWHDVLEDAWESGLRQGAKDAGYDAVRIDLKEHNNKICDEIVTEIRRSRFVIADFTGDRGGVYYEAGYALGMGKQVIWCCSREWHDEHGVHFDTRQYNHILWDAADDLRAKLRARIGATIHQSPAAD